MASLTNTKIKNTYVSLLKVADNGQLDAALQDITDGAGNVSGIQLNTGGDLTASGTVSFGSLKDSGENITITKFVDAADGIGANDNDTTIPTSAAVKTYVDTNITAQDLDFATDSGTGAVDLDSQTFSILGTANEIETSGTGQTVTIGLPSSITVDVTGNLTGNVSGNVTGNVTGNLSGNVTGDLTGSVLTAAQPNITSVGTLSSLTVAGALNGTISTAAQTNITSVGTLSSLTVSGNLTVDTDTLFVDAANNNVGIGTSSPNNTAGFTTLTLNNGSTGSIIDLESNATLVGRLYNDASNLYLYNQTANSLVFGTGGAEKARIDSSGNVGIGTSSVGANSALLVSKNNGYLSVNSNIGAGGATDPSYDNGIHFGWNRSNGDGESNIVWGKPSGLLGYLSFASWDGTTYSERMRIDSSGAIITQNGQIQYPNAGDLTLNASNASGEIAFRTAGNERMRILQGGGITFNGDTAAANALDDYEEGTWTPTIEGSVSNPTVTYTAAFTGGIYTKIGNKVTVSYEVRWSAITGGSGDVLIAGLPFARGTYSANGVYTDFNIVESYSNTLSGLYLVASLTNASTKLGMVLTRSGNTTLGLAVSDLANSNPSYLRGTFTYFT